MDRYFQEKKKINKWKKKLTVPYCVLSNRSSPSVVYYVIKTYPEKYFDGGQFVQPNTPLLYYIKHPYFKEKMIVKNIIIYNQRWQNIYRIWMWLIHLNYNIQKLSVKITIFIEILLQNYRLSCMYSRVGKQ